MLETCEQLSYERRETVQDFPSVRPETATNHVQSIGSLLPHVLARYLPTVSLPAAAVWESDAS